MLDSQDFCEIGFTYYANTTEKHTYRRLLKIQQPVSQSVSSVTHSCPTLCNPMSRSSASLSITNSQSLLKLMSIESLMPSSHLIPCRPLLLLPSIPPSVRVFSNESTLCMSLSFSFSISPSSEYPGLISFKMDWLNILEVQGTTARELVKAHLGNKALKNLIQYWMNTEWQIRLISYDDAASLKEELESISSYLSHLHFHEILFLVVMWKHPTLNLVQFYKFKTQDNRRKKYLSIKS